MPSLGDIAQRAQQPQVDFSAPPQPTLPANPANPNYSMLSRLASAANQLYAQPLKQNIETLINPMYGQGQVGSPEFVGAATDLAGMATGLGGAGAPEGALGSGFQFRFPKGIIAYHGSPHTFERFDPAKIGTGEGAQTYGHGLYFAENEDVARGYRERLSQNTPYERTAGYYLQKHKGNKQDAVMDLQRSIQIVNQDSARWWGKDPMVRNAYVNDLRSALQTLQDPEWKQPGSMYQVRLHADPEEFLNWDRPITQQSPLIQEYMRSKGVPETKDPYGINDPRPVEGNLAYHHLAREAGKRLQPNWPGITPRSLPGAASRDLQAAGIPGIRYLDAGSRAAQEGSSNYVVFNPQIIDILKRYGLTGPGLAALAYMANQQQQQNADPVSQ